jgi:predicted dehydrogenase
MNLWLIGAGAIAKDYAKVLQNLAQDFKVIGRSSPSARHFELATGQAVMPNGVSQALMVLDAPEQAIVAVGVEQLSAVVMELIQAGTRRILLEKPGGLNTAQIGEISTYATKHGAEVLIAYNRRFYASTTLARQLINQDGGATSCIFEFTEWSHVIEPLEKPQGVKNAWFLANSTHVVDLAFHLCGFPKELQAMQGGTLDWHPSSARFCGSGITQHGTLFSYHADWEAPGRWGVEVLTRKRRLILRPMEQLQIVSLGSVTVESLEIDDRRDKEFKPGLHGQVKSFLARDDRFFCTIVEQFQHCAIYDRMAGYDKVDIGTPVT